MARFIHPLLLIVARATDRELARYVEFLKEENRILRSKLPKRVQVSDLERGRLVELGKPLGTAVKELITIVSPRTFLRWLNDRNTGGRRKPRGRPRKPEEVRNLVGQMARDTGWGYRRIHGELLKIGISNISVSTVARILRECGVDPGPKRGSGTWHDFVQRHLKTLWACDFFTTTVWTWRGPVDYYVLFFIHVGTRRVHLAGITANPSSHWMSEQAEALCRYFDNQGENRPTHIVRDRDSKFTSRFCRTLEANGIEFRPTPPRSPNMNPFAETWVHSVKHECLRHFLAFGESHLKYLIEEYLEYYHEQRPHQGIGNRPPSGADAPREIIELHPQEVVCRERLGGVLKHYQRVAA